ncbi:MAG: glycosyltransferase family 4 protein [Clostridiaceae bacterium]|jgi:glycosyltransferase involved in cell wall biosynthesis|nr:glycosyltransferase family 4 protein [Clostridiaceae bacterium]
MKKVFMIAHQFPPIGGSGVQRTTKFLKYMPEFGWEGVVFTRDAEKAQLTDETLCTEIPEGTLIYRSNAWDLSELIPPLDLAGKYIRRRILVPDGERLWQIFSVKKAVEIVKNSNFQLIYSTSQPFSTHLLAMEIKKEFPDLPWVADFRDEWTHNAFVRAYGYSRRRIKKEKIMERSVFDRADKVVINTPFMKANSVGEYSELENKFHVIPNGYDKEDFEGFETGGRNEKFTLTYTGLIYGNTSPEIVFKAVSKLIAENAVNPSGIRMRFIGRFKVDELNRIANSYNLSGIVELLPYMPHRECLSNLVKSDAVLLLLGKGTEAIYTGKLMEYINTGKPILASVPAKGAAAALIKETRTGLVADCEDVEATAKCFKALYDNWLTGKDSFNPDKEKIARYERRELTRKLVEIFDSLC